MKRLNLKKYLSLLLALLLVFTLAACGNREDPPAVDATPDSTQSTGSTETVPPSEGSDTTESGDPSLGDKGEPLAPTNEEEGRTTASTSDATRPTKGTTGRDTVAPTTQPTKSTYIPTTQTATKTTAKTTVKTTHKTTTTTQGKPTYTPATGTHTTTAPSADKALVDQLFTLSVGASRENVTLFGVVTNVREVSDTHGNATFTIQVQSSDGFREIYCYRVKPAAGTALAVAVGDNLTLSGTVQNYKGTIEFYPAEFQNHSGGGVAVTTTTTASTTRPADGSIDVNGVYTRKEDVALYLHVYGQLPKNFVTKAQYKSLGRPTDKCCGGDNFYNKEGLLPNKAGRQYYECDIDTLGKTSRGTKRIVYSNDGLIYYTADHYGSFTLLYGEP